MYGFILGLLRNQFFWLIAFFTTYRLAWWTASGVRVYWRLIPVFKPVRGWKKLCTPSRVIFYCPEDNTANENIRRVFLQKVLLDEVAVIIVRVLSKESTTSDTRVMFRIWEDAIKRARYFRLYRREPLMAGGWAQTRTNRTSDCILGLEDLYSRCGRWTTHAVGHELVHVAQEIREKALRKEWDPTRHFIDELLVEWEAHYCFKLWPYTVFFCTTIIIVLIFCWQLLWP